MAYRNNGMYNQAWPQTPAPAQAGRSRFPLYPAAILETPSIMASFRESKVPYAKKAIPTPSEPPSMKFIAPDHSSSWQESMLANVNSSLPPSGRATATIPARSQALNVSFMDSSFTLSQCRPTLMQPKVVPLAPSNCSSLLNRSMPLWPERKYSAQSCTTNFPALGNFHRTQGSNLNSAISFFNNANSSTAPKRKYPEPRNAAAPVDGHSKYMKTSQGNTVKGCLPASSSTQADAKNTFDSKATMRIVSGTIDHIQKIIREQPRYPLLLETVANVLVVKCGTRPKEKVILLRNHNAGPVLQALYYEIDADLPPFVAGELVRCVGRLQPVGNRFQVLRISPTTEQHESAIGRLQTVSAFTTKVRR